MKTRLFEAKPFIIAEIGSNWGSFDDCKNSIQMAKQLGADAVKFQLFNDAALYGAGMWDSTRSAYGAFHHVLPAGWLPKLKEKADAAKIEFMCTAFSPEFVKAVDPYVAVHKIASSDSTTPQMLQAVKDTGKPVILSCGAMSRGDLKLALYGHSEISWQGFEMSYPLILLYCNAAYPSYEHNLFKMAELAEFKRPVGFSDHTKDIIYAPLSAQQHFGAVVIEKHLNCFPDMQTPDCKHSLNPHEFKIMVEHLRGQREVFFGPSSEEKGMFLRNNRRLIAIKDIAAGDLLQYGANFGAYRSLVDDDKGMLPFFWEELQGKPAQKDIKSGKGISIDAIE